MGDTAARMGEVCQIFYPRWRAYWLRRSGFIWLDRIPNLGLDGDITGRRGRRTFQVLLALIHLPLALCLPKKNVSLSSLAKSYCPFLPATRCGQSLYQRGLNLFSPLRGRIFNQGIDNRL